MKNNAVEFLKISRLSENYMFINRTASSPATEMFNLIFLITDALSTQTVNRRLAEGPISRLPSEMNET